MNIISGLNNVELVDVSVDDIDESLSYIAEMPDRRTLFLSRQNISEDLVAGILSRPLFERVRSLSIMAGVGNLDKFQDCAWLARINFGFAGSVFDFSQLNKLNKIGGVWSKKWTGLEKCTLLTDLHLSKFAGSIDDLPSLGSLSGLTLIQPALVDLAGLARMNSLLFLELSLASKLVDISELQSVERSLEELVIDGCKKIVNYDVLARLRGLKRLAVMGSAAIDSLSWLKDLDKIEYLNIFESPLRDKDLSPCLACPSLREFRCEDRRDYKPSVAEIISVIESRSST